VIEGSIGYGGISTQGQQYLRQQRCMEVNIGDDVSAHLNHFSIVKAGGYVQGRSTVLRLEVGIGATLCKSLRLLYSRCL
jgi:hypothetical protein